MKGMSIDDRVMALETANYELQSQLDDIREQLHVSENEKSQMQEELDELSHDFNGRERKQSIELETLLAEKEAIAQKCKDYERELSKDMSSSDDCLDREDDSEDATKLKLELKKIREEKRHSEKSLKKL